MLPARSHDRWTIIYCGLISEWSLPNARVYDNVTFYGDLDCPFFTHTLEDIGHITVRAALDPRARNACVHLTNPPNRVTQRQAWDLLKQCQPAWDGKVTHHDANKVCHLAVHATQDCAPFGHPEIERWEINRACFVRGFADYSPDAGHFSAAASELYPDYAFATPEQLLSDAAFVFGPEAAAAAAAASKDEAAGD